MQIIYRVINKVIRQTFWYKHIFGRVIIFRRQLSFHLEAINIGSTESRKLFNYELCHYNGMNWAFDSQPLQLSINLLKSYFSYLKPGKKVIIPICENDFRRTDIDRYNNFKYYTILHPAMIVQFSDQDRILANTMKDKPLLFLLKHPFLSMKLLRKQTIYSDEISYSDGIKLITDMVDFCLERDLIPIVCFLPVVSSMKYRTEFVEFLRADMISKNVKVLDYSNNLELSTNGLFMKNIIKEI